MKEREPFSYAADCAAALETDGKSGGGSLRRQLKAQLKGLKETETRLTYSDAVSRPAQWLLDNSWLARREGLEAMSNFRGCGFLRAANGNPYLMELARALVRAPFELTQPNIAQFLEGAQKSRALTEKELSLWVSAVKLALVERLSELSGEIEPQPAGEAEKKKEDLLAARLCVIFSALKLLGSADLSNVLEGASRVEQLLSKDPAGVYLQMSDDSRLRYRHMVCTLARKYGLSEEEVAQTVLRLSEKGAGEERHVGYYLFSHPLGRPAPLGSPILYSGAVLLVTLLVTFLLGASLHSGWVTLLLLFPVSDIVKNCADFLAVRMVHPRPVHRLALKDGIPPEGKTLCVIACLITDDEKSGELVTLLERYHLANREVGPNLLFGLLADLPDSTTPLNSAQMRRMEAVQKRVEALNKTYEGGFYLFFRRPQYHPGDERYRGWERKRGALIELVRLLRGRRTHLRILAGDPVELSDMRYIITLDSDTSLNVGTAREMVGAMLHPLNRPRIDARLRVVTDGYGLLQPRVGVELQAANRSHFSRIFAGQGGVDPYGSASSDVYHDLFDRGTYTGKGIFDIDAFFSCLDKRFPQNTVLSHDLLEGAYLKAGLLGDVELTDGYPQRVTAYFSRLHRWVRGDWQLLPWLGPRVRLENGAKEDNPLSAVDRFKIVDNLRRSISPVVTLAALMLGMCLKRPALAAASTAAILAALSNLLLSGADTAMRGGRGLRERYHSTVIAGPGGVIIQTLVQLLLLPAQAATCISAIARSLWRQIISHRGLLEWTTAAETEKKDKNSLLSYFRAQWPASLFGVMTMMFADLPAGGAVGLLWAISPLFAWAMSRPIPPSRKAAAEDFPFLLHEGALIWRYFADFLRPEDHWLPPDNWQEEPNPTLARRTSPTNVGLALLSVLAAADLELLEREKAVCLLCRMLSSIEELPKWKGHLYNWYDTATARPLEPRYVSTVDSGNLCGCLITLCEGLYEWGEDDLARRAKALSDRMELSALFDPERKLFTIGYDVTAGAFTEGWYDLMASEARQTSYLAVARGEVPPRHWRRLSRALVSHARYSGMASWTGTMFEYFMPSLLLPVYQNSLLYESLAFCLFVQRGRTARLSIPWGISESAFYALDGSLNYQYKAHGVQRLGLKRGLDSELVISPYSSFLALQLAPASSVANLRRLRDMGLEGKYGLFEAVDYTESRRTSDAPYEPVRCYMAHHLGMSLLAIDNALNDNIMQRRFMRDRSMLAYRELLQEKVPVGVVPLKSGVRIVPEKPKRAESGSFARSGIWNEGEWPVRHLVSNGAYTVSCDASGRSVSRMGNTTLFHSVFLTPGTKPIPTALTFCFSNSAELYCVAEEDLRAAQSLKVPQRENGELREITVTWSGSGEWRGELLFYLEPILAPLRDYEAHPAFSKLFVESAYTGDGVVFTRRPRGNVQEASLAVLWDASSAHFDTNREAALGRGGIKALEAVGSRPAQSSAGAVLDPCLLARFPISLIQGENHTVRIAISASSGAEDAVETALRLLRPPGKEKETGRLDRLISTCSMTGEDALRTFRLLDELTLFTEQRRWFDQSALWPYGISGDVPIAQIEIRDQDQADKASVWIASHRLLNRCGYSFDLVFLLSEGGNYHRPGREALLSALKAMDWTHKLGEKGGVHLLENVKSLPEGSALLLGEPIRFDPPPATIPKLPFALERGVPLWETDADGAFVFRTGPRLPPLAWSQILCNKRFGWFVDETGGGHLWLDNARENQLTPWPNDPLAIGGPEYLYLRAEGRLISLFADADGLECTVTYRPGFARWEKRYCGRSITTTAFVPTEQDVRFLIIELTGGEGELVHRVTGQRENCYPLQDETVLCTFPDESARGIKSFIQPGEAVGDAKQLLNRTIMEWSRRVSSLRVRTPNQRLNDYLNGWALYQVTACRLWGRTSRYQNGGAYGFRDQLQDVCALIPTAPEIVSEQILRACTHQYEEGDVQHWWHESKEGSKGVRTRISDDLLWLPYTLCKLWETWGDDSLLDRKAPYLISPVLGHEERERYEEPGVSAQAERVYDHAVRAVELFLERGRGSHCLARIGTGDWNDGMNLVGAQGKGESVWLTWFAAHVLYRFADICGHLGDWERVERYRQAAKELAEAANAAWDGKWFLRGYYDDGGTLGSSRDQYCQLDSIAQSFAVLSGYGDKEKSEQAVRTAVKRLYHPERGVVQLFDPPFDRDGTDPGYIRGYLPGVRENGGQYTHGAVWLAMACLRMGDVRSGYDILNALLPASHDPEIYKTEPYVLPADVYYNPAHAGRGGWSWYTGAAGWYYRVATEELLGLKISNGRLTVAPRLPGDWPGYTALWRNENYTLRIVVERGDRTELILDGEPCPEGLLLSECSGEHTLCFTFHE